MVGCALVHVSPPRLGRRRLLGLGVALLVGPLGCGGSKRNADSKLPAPVQSTSLGPGDVFRLQIVGEENLPEEYQVASDGSVFVPYVQRQTVAGLEPQEVAALVRKQLIEKQILTDPTVIVSVKEYQSKRVTLLGQVQSPGSFPLTPGLTLLEAISLAGGFTAIANKDRISITRKVEKGTVTEVVSADEIIEGESPNIPLQAGDSINVQERVF